MDRYPNRSCVVEDVGVDAFHLPTIAAAAAAADVCTGNNNATATPLREPIL
jgi:hypothetical protein